METKIVSKTNFEERPDKTLEELQEEVRLLNENELKQRAK